MEIGHEAVLLPLVLHHHPLVTEHHYQADRLVMVELDTHFTVVLYQRGFQVFITVLGFQSEYGFQSYTVLLFGNVLVRVELLLGRSACLFLFRNIVLYQS